MSPFYSALGVLNSGPGPSIPRVVPPFWKELFNLADVTSVDPYRFDSFFPARKIEVSMVKKG